MWTVFILPENRENLGRGAQPVRPNGLAKPSQEAKPRRLLGQKPTPSLLPHLSLPGLHQVNLLFLQCPQEGSCQHEQNGEDPFLPVSQWSWQFLYLISKVIPLPSSRKMTTSILVKLSWSLGVFPVSAKLLIELSQSILLLCDWTPFQYLNKNIPRKCVVCTHTHTHTVLLGKIIQNLEMGQWNTGCPFTAMQGVDQ